MSRRKPLHKYPEQYYQLFEEAQHRTVTVPFETASQARVFRVELYNMRAQVREALASDPTIVELAEHLLLMSNIEIQLRDTTIRLIRKSSPHLTAVQRALNERQ